MTVLLTGGTGFIGSYVTKILVQNNIEVVLLKRSYSNTYRIEKILPKVIVYDIDIVSVDDIFNIESIDQVIHLATNYGREESNSSVYHSNVLFPLTILESAIKSGVRRFINTDTFSSSIANLDYLKNYHITKRHFKEIGEQMAFSNSITFVTVFLQHPYGVLDSSKKFTSFIIDSLVNQVKHIDLTDGLQKRDFVHVKDVAKAYLTLVISKKLSVTEFDLGTGQSISIKRFVELSKKLANNDTTLLNFGKLPIRSNEIMNTRADISDLNRLNWYPSVSLEEGLTELIGWYRYKKPITESSANHSN